MSSLTFFKTLRTQIYFSAKTVPRYVIKIIILNNSGALTFDYSAQDSISGGFLRCEIVNLFVEVVA